MGKLHRSLFLFNGLLLIALIQAIDSHEAILYDLQKNASRYVQELADEVVALYSNSSRCSDETLRNCMNQNYADCLSLYPNQTCPAGESFLVSKCGDGITCSGLYDFTVSSVNLPYDVADGIYRRPRDPNVIETVCYTKQLDGWFKKMFQKFPQEFAGKVVPQGMYFGSVNGVFRIYPARQSDACGLYDPRVRPWYVAASSGPKNVLMILDTSESMKYRSRLSILQSAAEKVLMSLLPGVDRVGIVTFNDTAEVVDNQRDGPMFLATESNKEYLNDTIYKLVAEGSSNVSAAFNVAFNVLDVNLPDDQEQCNTAILFFSDADAGNLDSSSKIQLIEMVSSRTSSLQNISHAGNVVLFTYSIASEATAVEFHKELACATDHGIWEEIKEIEGIGDSLASYHRFLTLRLGNDTNFTTWVEPYVFQTGGVSGTTVSAPVYDHASSPPLFLGVVGMDFTIDALNVAIGLNSTSAATVDLTKYRASVAGSYCPTNVKNLTSCQLKAYLQPNNPCLNSNCTVNGGSLTQLCSNISWNGIDLWDNDANEGKTYSDRVCCKVGTNTSSDQCPVTEKSGEKKTGAIVGGVVGGFIALCLIVLGSIWYCGKEDSNGHVGSVMPSAPMYEEPQRIERPPPINPNLVSGTT